MKRHLHSAISPTFLFLSLTLSSGRRLGTSRAVKSPPPFKMVSSTERLPDKSDSDPVLKAAVALPNLPSPPGALDLVFIGSVCLRERPDNLLGVEGP